MKVLQFTRGLRALLLGLLLGSAFLLSACSTTQDVYDETAGWSADRLYSEAKDELEAGNWPTAIKYLEKLESRYPFGRYAEQAQIDSAYAHYKSGEPAQAIATLDRFIKLHPNHSAMDYALYLKGLANFNDGGGLIGRLGGQDPSERDPKAAQDAFEAFRELVKRFPDSKYAADASARMEYLVNAMAKGELAIARYYLRQNANVAAANRAQSVLRRFEGTPATEEALAIMVTAYDRLNLTDLRDDSRRVLQRTFPQSAWISGYTPSATAPDAAKRPWWQIW